MNLDQRDLFALVAMHAQVSARAGLGLLTQETARNAYKMADAMLKERDQSRPGAPS